MDLPIFCIPASYLQVSIQGGAGANAEVELSGAAAELNCSLQSELQVRHKNRMCPHSSAGLSSSIALHHLALTLSQRCVFNWVWLPS
jgi:hypothetical protein